MIPKVVLLTLWLKFRQGQFQSWLVLLQNSKNYFTSMISNGADQTYILIRFATSISLDVCKLVIIIIIK